MVYIHDNFLLDTKTACELYHKYAADQPIIDYHCHLPPVDLATNRRFKNLYEIWMPGDHYKWRAMRLNGEAERFCTGDADPYDKFLAFARTVPNALRNPIYHWTHLELKRYFGIDTLLSERTAPAIWETANAMLAGDTFSAWGILKQRKVEMIGTTDDPIGDLRQHEVIAASACPAKVLPSFRPDQAFLIDQNHSWNAWVDQLSKVSGTSCENLGGFLEAMELRIQDFDKLGCVASDHSIPRCANAIGSEAEAKSVFEAARSGKLVSTDDADAFAGYLQCWLGERYADLGWVMQLHLGAIRNVDGAMLAKYGKDIGCDSMHDMDQILGLAAVLGELSRRGKLPKTILYNLDPSKNYAFAAMCGNFSEPGIRTKVQFGSGWWFSDQLEGMTAQINTLSNLGLLSNFIGMLTDSRSLLSYPRHEYFRRLLCRLLGREMEEGMIPPDIEMVGSLVSDVCYNNAKAYFKL